MVYRGFGNFSIILYIYTWGGGRLPALPKVNQVLFAEIKKVIPRNIAWGYFGVLLVIAWENFRWYKFL